MTYARAFYPIDAVSFPFVSISVIVEMEDFCFNEHIFFLCVFELPCFGSYYSSRAHQGCQDIGTSVPDDHSPAVIGNQNEFLH